MAQAKNLIVRFFTSITLRRIGAIIFDAIAIVLMSEVLSLIHRVIDPQYYFFTSYFKISIILYYVTAIINGTHQTLGNRLMKISSNQVRFDGDSALVRRVFWWILPSQTPYFWMFIGSAFRIGGHDSMIEVDLVIVIISLLLDTVRFRGSTVVEKVLGIRNESQKKVEKVRSSLPFAGAIIVLHTISINPLEWYPLARDMIATKFQPTALPVTYRWGKITIYESEVSRYTGKNRHKVFFIDSKSNVLKEFYSDSPRFRNTFKGVDLDGNEILELEHKDTNKDSTYWYTLDSTKIKRYGSIAGANEYEITEYADVNGDGFLDARMASDIEEWIDPRTGKKVLPVEPKNDSISIPSNTGSN